MENTSNVKRPYVAPTLERRGKLSEITAVVIS
jgi:hypothetical protein